jgi:hypothetical protein
MMGWDACTQEPLAAIRWIECHPGTAGWVQTLGILLAIATAVVIPWIIHSHHHRAPAPSEARFNAGVRGALQEAREAIKEFLTQGAICFSTEAKNENLQAVTFHLLWPLSEYSSAVDRLPRVLALCDIDRSQAMKAVAVLTDAIDQRRDLVKRTIRTLTFYNSSEAILRECYERIAKEFVLLDDTLKDTAEAFPLPPT